MQKPFEITYGMLATGNKRFLNFVIDSIIVYILQMVVTLGGNRIFEIYKIEEFNIGQPVMQNLKFALLALGLNIVYYGLFESVTMRTPGKYITNTMVVNRDGSTPDNMRIFIRTLCRLIPLEFITFFGSRPVGLHDGLSKTLVVDIAEFRRAEQQNRFNQEKQNEKEENNDNEQG